VVHLNKIVDSLTHKIAEFEQPLARLFS